MTFSAYTRNKRAKKGDETTMNSKFSRFPITWMLAGALGIILIDSLLRPLAYQAGEVASLAITFVEGSIAILVYRLTMKYLANRPTPEITKQRAGIEAGMGLVTGVLFILVSILIIVVAGGYTFQWASSADTSSILASSITSALGAAFVEELIFRGLMFQAITKLAGSWLALAVTSLFFGVAHLGNTGATLWSAFAISIEAGVLLGAAFIWRRNLWFVMGLHFGWNAVEGLLGIPVSGHSTTGLFTVKAEGAALLTGGTFGLEASIVPVVVSLAITIPMLMVAKRKQPSFKEI